MLNLPGDVDAPHLLRRRLEAQTLEGDPDLDLVAPLGDPPLGLEDVVRAQIRALPANHRIGEPIEVERVRTRQSHIHGAAGPVGAA